MVVRQCQVGLWSGRQSSTPISGSKGQRLTELKCTSELRLSRQFICNSGDARITILSSRISSFYIDEVSYSVFNNALVDIVWNTKHIKLKKCIKHLLKQQIPQKWCWHEFNNDIRIRIPIMKHEKINHRFIATIQSNYELRKVSIIEFLQRLWAYTSTTWHTLNYSLTSYYTNNLQLPLKVI